MLTVIRGLDIRVAFAKAKIIAITNPGMADDLKLDACLEAQACGARDYRNGSDMPLMFADEPDLKMFWEDGKGFAESMEEMAHCPCCNDDTGNPCPTHG